MVQMLDALYEEVHLVQLSAISTHAPLKDLAATQPNCSSYSSCNEEAVATHPHVAKQA